MWNFFKGLSIGLIGAAFSQVTSGLKIADNSFIGTKNVALIFNPKLKNERFRYNSYNEDEALIRAILDYLGGYDEHEIIYFKEFKYINPGLQGSDSTLILTNKYVMIIYQAKELVFKLDLNLIRRAEVYKEQNNNINIDLIFSIIEGGRIQQIRIIASVPTQDSNNI